MSKDQQAQDQDKDAGDKLADAQENRQDSAQEHAQEHVQETRQSREHEAAQALNDVDGLADKKPEELTQEELRLMADTMPGEGPGD